MRTRTWVTGWLVASVCCMASAQNVAYCNITSVTAQQLSNGVQVTVKADASPGMLRRARRR